MNPSLTFFLVVVIILLVGIANLFLLDRRVQRRDAAQARERNPDAKVKESGAP